MPHSVMCYNATEDKMSKIISDDKQVGVGGGERTKSGIIALLALLIIIAISIGIFFYGQDPERVAELEKYRYLGAFLIGLIGNATILLPGIVLPILTALGVDLYQSAGGLVGPIVIGMAGAFGAAIGETVGYMAGYSGRGIVMKRKQFARVVEWVRRWEAIAIFVLSLVPLFFDLVGIAAGILRFPLWKFVLLCWLGRTLLYVGIVVAVALGWEAVLPPIG